VVASALGSQPPITAFQSSRWIDTSFGVENALLVELKGDRNMYFMYRRKSRLKRWMEEGKDLG
jgi:hypothetical protein